MESSDLKFYLNWLKEQLKLPVSVDGLFLRHGFRVKMFNWLKDQL